MQLFSSISASLLLLGHVSAGMGTTSSAAKRALTEARAQQHAEEVDALVASALSAIHADHPVVPAIGVPSMRSIDSRVAQASERFAYARAIEVNAATSAEALGGSSGRSLDTEAAQASGRSFERARANARVEEQNAVTSVEALGGLSGRSLDTEAAQASGRSFERARRVEESAADAHSKTTLINGVAINLEKFDRGLVGALGDEKRAAALVDVLKLDSEWTLKSNLEQAAKRNPAVKEALGKASVTHPELAHLFESA